MFGRNIKTCLPEWNHSIATRIEQEIIDNDQLAKGKMTSYADKRRNTKECDIKVGDKVLVVKPAGFRKKTYDPVPYTVTVIPVTISRSAIHSCSIYYLCNFGVMYLFKGHSFLNMLNVAFRFPLNTFKLM